MNKLISVIKLAVSLCLIITLTICTPTSARASNDLPPEYLAGFAFFKYAKVAPDFKFWVAKSPAYMQATPRERSAMLRIEPENLQNTFNNFVIEDNPITVKTRVSFRTPSLTMAKRMLAEQGAAIVNLEMVDQPDKLFPLHVADMWIGLIPENIEDHLELRLSEEEFINFKKQTEDQKLIGHAEGIISLTLLPTAADTKRPFVLNGYELWMLMADVVSLEIWSEDGKTMAWYKDIDSRVSTKQSRDIYNLYKD